MGKELFKSGYAAVMEGMGAASCLDDDRLGYEFRCIFAMDALRAIGEIDAPGSWTAFYSAGSTVGFVKHQTAEDAVSWAEGTHPSQGPAAYKVERGPRGFHVEKLF